MKKYALIIISVLFLVSCLGPQPKPEDDSERLMRLAQQTAGSKLTDLTALTAPGAPTDLVMAVDVSDTSMNATGTNKKMTLQDLWAYPRTPLSKTANYIIETDSTRECYGGIFDNQGASGAITFTLPDAIAGMVVTIIVDEAYDVDIDPNGTERIMVMTDTNGDSISSDATQGSMVSLYAISATEWMRVGSIGTWTDAN